MERILKNERRVEGDGKRYLLRYTLVSNGFPKEEGEGIYYGIITEQFVWTDEGERWEAQDIFHQWGNLQEKITRCVFVKMEKMYIFQLKIQKKSIALMRLA